MTTSCAGYAAGFSTFLNTQNCLLFLDPIFLKAPLSNIYSSNSSVFVEAVVVGPIERAASNDAVVPDCWGVVVAHPFFGADKNFRLRRKISLVVLQLEYNQGL